MRICAVVLLAFVLAGPLVAQPTEAPVPRVHDAELVFEQGVQAFEEGDYGMAYRRFRLVYSGYPLNRKTTAAMLMAGKSLYRDGQLRQAVEEMDTLIRRYPTSGYLAEARRVREFALELIDDPVPGVVDLGIVLPMGGDDAALTQALFTGVRIAVEEHNALNPGVEVRLRFRDSGGDPGRASAAVGELAGLGTGLVIGPLYSHEAVAAAEAAERNRIVLLAPLANDEAVSDGRRYVFQANPTITTHGRMMARFAIRNLMIDSFGIIAERDRDQISERMAEGFYEEVMLQGAQLEYYRVVQGLGDWHRLASLVGADTLLRARAVYVPVSGGDAVVRVDAALHNLDQSQLSNRIRVLGNSEYHDLPGPMRASLFQTTYGSDFHVEESDASVRAFMNRFQEIVGQRPAPETTVGRLAFTGYDVTRYLIAQLTQSSDVPLEERLRRAPVYQGLGMRIDFTNGNVNEALFYFRYQDTAARLLR